MKIIKVLATLTLSAALLAGSLTAFSTADAAATTKTTTSAAKTAVNNKNVIIGKIKSISSGKITIYKSSTQPAIPSGTEGSTAPKAGEAPPSGEAPTPPAAGEAKANAGGQPPAQTFSTAATTLTTTSATSVVSVTHAAGSTKTTETHKSLSSLKAGDIVFVTLASGSTTKVSKIELMPAQTTAKTTAKATTTK
ncbi:hypothetical protein [Paenibacillus sp. Z6-24]